MSTPAVGQSTRTGTAPVRSGRRGELTRALGSWRSRGQLYFPISGLALLAVWYAMTDFVRVPDYVMPTIPDTLQALQIGVIERAFLPSGLIVPLLASLKAAAMGYVLAVVLASTLAALMAESQAIRGATMPYVVGFQSLPKVALAPLVIIWFGFGIEAKVAMATLTCFFPILISVFTGLSSINRDQLELFRSLRATRRQIFLYVKLPTAAPTIFAGLDMGIVFALLGTIVAEFVSAQEGIGISIVQMRFVNDTAGVFAALFLLGLTGVALHAFVRFVEHRVIYWSELEGGLRLT